MGGGGEYEGKHYIFLEYLKTKIMKGVEASILPVLTSSIASPRREERKWRRRGGKGKVSITPPSLSFGKEGGRLEGEGG